MPHQQTTATVESRRLSEEEIETVKRMHPLAEVAASYGLDVKREGSRLVCHCPFHSENTASFTLFPTQHFYCFGCSIGGDVIDLVRRLEGIGFREAMERLQGTPGARSMRTTPTQQPGASWPQRDYARIRQSQLGQAILRAAQRVYTQALQDTPAAQAYLTRRGLSLDLAIRCGLGYCRGDALAQELRRRGISLAAARELGLLVGPEQRERFAGRITIPELRKGQPLWMTGRRIDDTANADGKYMSLPGPRPLLGKDWIVGHTTVYGGEGVFDWLTLLEWELPAFGWLGGSLSPLALAELEGVPLIYLVPDRDEAGQTIGETVATQVGRERVHMIRLPEGAKDINDLAQQPESKRRFREALHQAQPPGRRGES